MYIIIIVKLAAPAVISSSSVLSFGGVARFVATHRRTLWSRRSGRPPTSSHHRRGNKQSRLAHCHRRTVTWVDVTRGGQVSETSDNWVRLRWNISVTRNHLPPSQPHTMLVGSALITGRNPRCLKFVGMRSTRLKGDAVGSNCSVHCSQYERLIAGDV